MARKSREAPIEWCVAVNTGFELPFSLGDKLVKWRVFERYPRFRPNSKIETDDQSVRLLSIKRCDDLMTLNDFEGHLSYFNPF